MFHLDERLQQDTFFITGLALCDLLLLNNAHYPWLILVPRRVDISEIHQLDAQDRDRLWRESHRLSVWMAAYFTFDKLNIGALGNVVSQLHLHHVGRRRDDPAWPGPVWGHGARIPYLPEEVANLSAAIRAGISGQDG